MRKGSIVVVVGLLGGRGKPSAGPGRRDEGTPLETRAPAATTQAPAFAGQTRAPFHSAHVRFDTQ